MSLDTNLEELKLKDTHCYSNSSCYSQTSEPAQMFSSMRVVKQIVPVHTWKPLGNTASKPWAQPRTAPQWPVLSDRSIPSSHILCDSSSATLWQGNPVGPESSGSTILRWKIFLKYTWMEHIFPKQYSITTTYIVFHVPSNLGMI